MKSTTKKILASSLGMAGAMAMGTVTAKADTTITVNAGDNLNAIAQKYNVSACLLYTSPSPRDVEESRFAASAW